MLKEIDEKIWRVDAEKTGPRIAILGGVHGNERTGVEVIKRLVEVFASEKKILTRGALYLLLGNLRAMKQNLRYTKNGMDLNRLFHPRLLTEKPRTYEQKRAREIAKILRGVHISIDIHATIKPSVPFLACSTTARHKRIYRWFETDRVLADPHQILGGKRVTTDEYVDGRGGIGICYESGWVQDLSCVHRVVNNVFDVLRDQRMLRDGVKIKPPKKKKMIFELTARLDLTKKGFRYATGMGASSFQAYRKGETIGFVGDQPFIAKEAGMILFPKQEKTWRTGQPVGYLARRTK